MSNQVTLTKPKSIYTILSEITGYPYNTCYAILKGQRSAKSNAGQKIMQSYEQIKDEYQRYNNKKVKNETITYAGRNNGNH